LLEKGIDESTFDILFELLTISGKPKEILTKISKRIDSETGKQGIKELKELFGFLEASDTKKNVILTLNLARGLEIYTGTVFEVFLCDRSIGSSLAGGGRFNKIIGKFLQDEKEYPAVGISFGLDVICEAFKLKGKIEQKSNVRVYIIPIKTVNRCLEIARKLRNAEIETDMDLLEKGVRKSLDYANKAGIPYVMIIGEKEMNEKKVNLKNMLTGKEELISINEAVDILGGKQNEKQ